MISKFWWNERWLRLALFFSVYYILALTTKISAQDVFCGQLKVHKQKWLSKSATPLSSQKTADLKECIRACCAIPQCNAVTFIGFLADKRADNSTESAPNCMLFNCLGERDCSVLDHSVAREGVLSVIITDNDRAILPMPKQMAQPEAAQLPVPGPPPALLPPLFSTSSTGNEFVTSERDTDVQPAHSREDDDVNRTFSHIVVNNPNTITDGPSQNGRAAAVGKVLPVAPSNEEQPFHSDQSLEATTSSSDSSNHNPFHAHTDAELLTPVWAIGLAIVIGVVCGGLSLALIGCMLLTLPLGLHDDRCEERKQHRVDQGMDWLSSAQMRYQFMLITGSILAQAAADLEVGSDFIRPLSEWMDKIAVLH
ncbi:MANEC domain-containing protein [Ditylenchus destructor]|uniref:MANEC domain-containing protein n=1 Tax=Ditylenchus destructor TaxID=166010 RepID=A0AAD4NH37_9BILA|nr:MANEC domain-containing protein [Ditylenchus destructor]